MQDKSLKHLSAPSHCSDISDISVWELAIDVLVTQIVRQIKSYFDSSNGIKNTHEKIFHSKNQQISRSCHSFSFIILITT